MSIERFPVSLSISIIRIVETESPRWLPRPPADLKSHWNELLLGVFLTEWTGGSVFVGISSENMHGMVIIE
jgi:hypothetical protein